VLPPGFDGIPDASLTTAQKLAQGWVEADGSTPVASTEAELAAAQESATNRYGTDLASVTPDGTDAGTVTPPDFNEAAVVPDPTVTPAGADPVEDPVPAGYDSFAATNDAVDYPLAATPTVDPGGDSPSAAVDGH